MDLSGLKNKQLFSSAVTGTGRKHNFNIPLDIILEGASAQPEPSQPEPSAPSTRMGNSSSIVLTTCVVLISIWFMCLLCLFVYKNALPLHDNPNPCCVSFHGNYAFFYWIKKELCKLKTYINYQCINYCYPGFSVHFSIVCISANKQDSKSIFLYPGILQQCKKMSVSLNLLFNNIIGPTICLEILIISDSKHSEIMSHSYKFMGLVFKIVRLKSSNPTKTKNPHTFYLVCTVEVHYQFWRVFIVT